MANVKQNLITHLWSLLIFTILNFRNIGRSSTFVRSKFGANPIFSLPLFIVDYECALKFRATGWRSKFGTTKYRTTGISKFRNCEYYNKER